LKEKEITEDVPIETILAVVSEEAVDVEVTRIMKEK
jgi:hypothetical protein